MEAQISLLIDLLDQLDDAEPSLGWQTGNQSPQHHSQAGADFIGNGDDREDEDEREPLVDDEPSLGWTSTTNQASSHWNQVAPAFWGSSDLEQGVGPVKKRRPMSRTGNRVMAGAELLR
ncbi:hypothetical protein ACVIHH_003658 [Bradyrhizobium sp. USDA 4518]